MFNVGKMFPFEKGIRIENQFVNWGRRKTNVGLVLDATTFGCYDTFPFDKAMWDVKRHKAGLKYDVAHAVHNGFIVHWSGWYKGSVSDIKMFRKGLMKKLQDGEMVESDSGCSGESCLKNPETAKSRFAKQKKGVARAKQECFFAMLKKFESLRGIWKHSYDKHELAVGAVLVTIQLGLVLGTVELFDIGDYDVEYF